MSIFGTTLALGDEHDEHCAKWVPEPEMGDGFWCLAPDRECTCGQPDRPWVYLGSHVLPGPDAPRGGSLDLAMIPDHVSRPGIPAGLHDHLRLTVTEDARTPHPQTGEATILIDRAQATAVRDDLTRWLEREPDRD